MLREELPNVPSVFSLFDSAVVFDGEIPLPQLVEALAGYTGLKSYLNNASPKEITLYV